MGFIKFPDKRTAKRIGILVAVFVAVVLITFVVVRFVGDLFS